MKLGYIMSYNNSVKTWKKSREKGLSYVRGGDAVFCICLSALKWCLLGVKKSLGHAQIGLLEEFKFFDEHLRPFMSQQILSGKNV